jgi:hypothetical protein
MSRLENIRAMQLAARRDPVDAALAALAALTDAQRHELVEAFNRTFGRATPPQALAYTITSQGGQHE